MNSGTIPEPILAPTKNHGFEITLLAYSILLAPFHLGPYATMASGEM